MRTLISILIVLLVAAMAQADMTTWLLGETDIDSDQGMIQARVGYLHNDVEVGLSSTAPPQVYGAYGLYHLGDVVDVNLPIPYAGILKAKPYVGAQLSVDFGGDGDEAFAGPIAGLVIQEVMVLEYQYRLYDDVLEGLLTDEHRVLFGLRVQF